MISVEKFWSIFILLLCILFSCIAYATENYIIKEDTPTNETILKPNFNDNVWVVDTISKTKTEPIKKIKQTVSKNEKETVKEVSSNFPSNLLKLAMTFVGIVATFAIIGVLGMLSWVCVFVWVSIKKR